MEIHFVRAAQKEFDALPKDIQIRLAPKIGQLAQGMTSQCKKLSGQPNRYRLRMGDYRVIFDVQNEKLIILVLRIAHRREAYR